jgi:hypothetical protein
VKAYNRFLKFEGDVLIEDRAEDFHILLRTGTTEGKIAAKKSLEEFGATDGNGKLWVRGLEAVQEKGYRYITQFELDQITANGGNLPLHKTRDGQYFTLDGAYATGEAAKSALQLPRPAGEYIGRVEFNIAPVKDNIRIPRGMGDAADWFEPLARDNPDLGTTGGGSQLLLDSIQVEVTFTPF